MLRGYRGVIAALVGGLILAAAQKPTEQTEAKKSGDATPQAAATKPTAREPSFAAYPNLNAEACYKAQDHDAADLCAQWRAALAAEHSAAIAEKATKWSIAATILSGIALGCLLVTIWQTGRSLREVRRGNLSTQRANARATRQAVAGARDTQAALSRDRAWVMVGDIVTIDISDGEFPDGSHGSTYGFQVGFKNVGVTPATSSAFMAANATCAIEDVEQAVADFAALPIPPGEGQAVLGPTMAAGATPVFVPLDKVESFKSTKTAFLVRARATYRDIYSPEIERATDVQFVAYHQGGTHTDADGRSKPAIVWQYAGKNTAT